MGYGLFVTGPLDPKVFRELEQRILDYIRSGKKEETDLDHPEAVALALRSVGGDLKDPLVLESTDICGWFLMPPNCFLRFWIDPSGRG